MPVTRSPFLLSCLLWLACGQPLYAASYRTDGDIIGAIDYYTIKKGDNLYAIARQFDIGIVELLTANPGVNVKSPEEGRELTITTMHILPEPRQGVVLNLSELRLFYYGEGGEVLTFPIGIGREGWQTPLGDTVITRKRKNPAWTPPASIRAENPKLPDVVPPGPDNPLGAFALNLGFPGYAIHSTTQPYSIGKRSSHGCIRLYPEDISVLFHAVEVDTPVTIIDTPYKLGWQDDALFLEVSPTQKQSDDIAKHRPPRPVSIPEIYYAVRNAAGPLYIDWDIVDEIVASRSGIPVVIAMRMRR